jgi:hypothetical protein
MKSYRGMVVETKNKFHIGNCNRIKAVDILMRNIKLKIHQIQVLMSSSECISKIH